MKKLALAVMLIATTALAGILVLGNTETTLSDCPSGGSVGATAISAGDYLLKITDADTTLCLLQDSATTCASGGVKYSANFSAVVRITSNYTHVRCRSATSTGDVSLAPVTLMER